MSDKDNSTYELATFAAGCFWGVESIFKQVKGVIETTVGYTGGTYPNPIYRDVCTGITGHAEAVLINMTLNRILRRAAFNILGGHTTQPLPIAKGQMWALSTDLPSSTHNEAQRIAAERSKEEFDRSGVYIDKAITQIVPASAFYDSEDYHQDYFVKHGGRSCHVLRSK